MDVFEKLVERIIKEQEGIIGPVALEQAQKVQGLKMDWQKREIVIDGNKTIVIETLVEQYKGLFGQASVEACKEAVRGIIADVPKDQIPPLLQ